MDILDYIEKLERLDILKLAKESIEETSVQLADLNREQLGEGKRSDNDNIHWLKDSHYPYVKPYARKRQKLGLQTKVVDLNVTRDFWNSIDAQINGEDIVFDGHSEIAKYLEINYSKEIYALNDEKTEKYIDVLEPVFFEKLEKQI